MISHLAFNSQQKVCYAALIHNSHIAIQFTQLHSHPCNHPSLTEFDEHIWTNFCNSKSRMCKIQHAIANRRHRQVKL